MAVRDRDGALLWQLVCSGAERYRLAGSDHSARWGRLSCRMALPGGGRSPLTAFPAYRLLLTAPGSLVLARPSEKQHGNRSEDPQVARDPHQQSAEALIVQHREPPGSRSGLVPGVE